MIYCNIRKEHIKPEVGQVWAVYNTDIEIVSNYVEIIHICKKKRTYPVLAENVDGSVCGFTTHGLHRFSHLQLGHLQKSTKPPSPWQPIQDAPKDGSTVLVYHKPLNAVFTGKWCWICKLWEYDIAEDIIPAGLSHWMPLPDAPKTESV